MLWYAKFVCLWGTPSYFSIFQTLDMKTMSIVYSENSFYIQQTNPACFIHYISGSLFIRKPISVHISGSFCTRNSISFYITILSATLKPISLHISRWQRMH